MSSRDAVLELAPVFARPVLHNFLAKQGNNEQLSQIFEAIDLLAASAGMEPMQFIREGHLLKTATAMIGVPERPQRELHMTQCPKCHHITYEVSHE